MRELENFDVVSRDRQCQNMESIHLIAYSTRNLYEVRDQNVFNREERKVLSLFDRKVNRDWLENELLFDDLEWEDVVFLVRKRSLNRATATIAIAWMEAKLCWSGLAEKPIEFQLNLVEKTLDAIIETTSHGSLDARDAVEIATARLSDDLKETNNTELVKSIWDLLIAIVFRNEISERSIDDDFDEDFEPSWLHFRDFELLTAINPLSLLESAKESCLNGLGSLNKASSLKGTLPSRMIDFLKE